MIAFFSLLVKSIFQPHVRLLNASYSFFNNTDAGTPNFSIKLLGTSVIETIEKGKKTYQSYPEGNVVEPLTKEEAIKITAQKTTLNPMEVSLVTELYPGAEYRGDLPVYKVTTDTKDSINVYVGYMTGDIGSIRSDSWRIWDFLWSLHIMDYRERDNINNILLQILSVLALVTSVSGITLFFVKR